MVNDGAGFGINEGATMRMILRSTAIVALVLATAAHAGGGTSGPPTGDPCDLDPDSCSGGGVDDPGGTGGTGGGTGSGGGGTGSGGGVTTPYTYGSGIKLFTLDSLPTGPSGTQAYFQPAQDNSAFGLPSLPSAQGVLTETVGGTTVSFRTDTFVLGSGAAATSIRTGNDSTNFPYLGVPAGVGVGLLATGFGSPAGPITVNFSDTLSYFSINLYRLSGAFDVTSTVTAYSGVDGQGSVLGSAIGTITGGTDFAFTTIELAQLNGAKSFTLQGTFLSNYDAITATLGSPAVPEPATWAMFVTGFGLIGARLRRRQRGLLAV